MKTLSHNKKHYPDESVVMSLNGQAQGRRSLGFFIGGVK